MTIYYLCPSVETPVGGVRQIYRHVDILNNHGIPAYVLHSEQGFKCEWFVNKTAVAYINSSFLTKSSQFLFPFTKLREKVLPSHPLLKLGQGLSCELPSGERVTRALTAKDIVVAPEFYGKAITELVAPPVTLVIFNQGHYLTYNGYDLDEASIQSPYEDPRVLATFTVSRAGEKFLRFSFPKQRIYRLGIAIDQEHFHFAEPKEKIICFTTKRQDSVLVPLIQSIRRSKATEDYSFVALRNKSQQEIASLMKRASIFLSTAHQEGFGLPAAEAMACGCVVVGYHGDGGREFLKPEHSFPVEEGDIIRFTEIVEDVCRMIEEEPEKIAEFRKKAAQFIEKNYSEAEEESKLLAAWEEVLTMAPR